MQKQTASTYRPEITFAGVNFTACSHDSSGPIPSFWSRGPKIAENQISLEDDHSFPSPTVSIYNIGLGAATNIQVRWNFPIERIADETNKLAQRALVPAYFEYKSDSLKFQSEAWRQIQYYSIWHNQRESEIDYILPESTQRSEVEVEIPDAVTKLISSYIYFNAIQKRDTPTWELDIPPLEATISYSDISGEKRTQRFDLNFRVTYISNCRDTTPTTVLLRIEPVKIR
jgi:hypothetical protein